MEFINSGEKKRSDASQSDRGGTRNASDGIPGFKQKALAWANQFEVCCVLDNNACLNAFGLHDIEFAVAAGVKEEITGDGNKDWEKLDGFLRKASDDHVFGFLTYDLKNQVEKLSSSNADGIQFPSLYFFRPAHLILINKDKECFISSDIKNLYEIINDSTPPEASAAGGPVPQIQPRVSKETYIGNVEHIRNHIIEGDVYELNYCVEFFDDKTAIDSLQTFLRLKEKSPTPFGAYFKLRDKYLMCASPERFLKKQGSKLYSQPIKGTVRRGEDNETDQRLKSELYHSEKERAENLMIVDLVRNDLARSSETGSIQVEELYGIYSFSQLHQMISTISSVSKSGLSHVEIIRHAFPMGSMTGAPKIRAMELIEKYEVTKRGLYSGTVGYFTAKGDFDFNVVIRSIQYNASTGYLNFEVGSAITFDSDAEKEYEECLLKAKAIMEVLETNR